MSLKRILAFSSSRVGNGGYLEKAAPLIKSFLGDKPLSIAFIPFASVDENYEEYITMVRKGLAGSIHKFALVLPDKIVAVLKYCDAIMVGGGNTFKLLDDLSSTRLMPYIKDLVSQGVPYIGWSAGSNITGLTIQTTNDMPIVKPFNFNALELFPFQINPHYHNIKIEGQNGETRDQRLMEFMMMNPRERVVGLPEGSALKLDKGVLRLIGEVGGVLFLMEDGKIIKKEIGVGEDLSFLM